MDNTPPPPNPPPQHGSATAPPNPPRRLLARLKPRDWVELFALANLGAHSVHAYARWAEWVPIGFSAAAPLILLVALAGGRFDFTRRGWPRTLGLLVGWCAVAVGVAGLVLHLNSQFFQLYTLKSLVYTAPFVAPLSYAGLGLLLILNRMVPHHSPEWPGWVLLLTAGGFFGNFVLSLADHAANGFYAPTEWVPVIAAAFATTFLLVPLLTPVTRAYVRVCAAVLAAQVAVGLLGFALHLRFDLHHAVGPFAERFIHGAPAFAPLLFANLAILGGIALWAVLATIARTSTGVSGNPSPEL